MKYVSLVVLVLALSATPLMAGPDPILMDGHPCLAQEEQPQEIGEKQQTSEASIDAKPAEESTEAEDKADEAGSEAETESDGIPVAFVLPYSVMYGILMFLYPAIAAFLGSYLLRASSRRLPAWAVLGMSAIWPVTVSLGLVAFPAWTAYHLFSNYGGSIRRVLSGQMGSAIALARFVLHQKVSVVGSGATREGFALPRGNRGVITGQQADWYQVDLNALGGGGVHWIHQDNLAVYNG